MGVQSARFFAESISKPLHLTNCHLYMRAEMDHAFPIFPCFDKIIKPVLGSFPRFCPQVSFEHGCGVPPNLHLVQKGAAGHSCTMPCCLSMPIGDILRLTAYHTSIGH